MIEKIILDPIINICLIYAFLITEYFKHIEEYPNQTNNDRTTVSNASVLKGATFGTFIINCNENNTDIYTWEIKINSIGSEINIGVDEVNDNRAHAFSTYYCLNYLSYAYSNVSIIDQGNTIDLDDEFCYSADDIITMVIDCGKKTVDFYKNDKHVYQCKNVHPNQYRLAIQLCARFLDVQDIYDDFGDHSASVTLQNFSISVHK